MEDVSDVADGEAGFFGDLFVGEVFFEFHFHESAGAFVESSETEADEADAFEAEDLFIGKRVGIRSWNFFALGELGHGDDFFGGAAMIEREVVHGAEEPAARLANFVKLCVQFHERFLDDIFGGFALAHEANGIAEQRRLEGCEKLFDGLWSRHFSFFGHWAGQRHALCFGIMSLARLRDHTVYDT